MEKYSVLMSVYYKNSPEELRQSIDSMLSQTVLCSQFVIVKDGCITDELNEVINDYAEKYPGLFTLVTLQNNVGGGGHSTPDFVNANMNLWREWTLTIFHGPKGAKNFCGFMTRIRGLQLQGQILMNFTMTPKT